MLGPMTQASFAIFDSAAVEEFVGFGLGMW